MQGSAGMIHIGDIAVEDVWRALAADPNAVLVDVRTRAEWAFVGVPDLSELGRRVITVEWQTFPESRVDPAFADRLAAALRQEKDRDEGAAVALGRPMYFICRSGGRSRMAAETMAARGFTDCWNVADGFEGPLDNDRHRGAIAGWKFAGLPWVQG